MFAANDRSSNSNTCKLDDGALQLDLVDEYDDFVLLPTTDAYHYGAGLEDFERREIKADAPASDASPLQQPSAGGGDTGKAGPPQRGSDCPAGTSQPSHDASSDCWSPLPPSAAGPSCDAACDGASAMDFDSQFDVVEPLDERELAGVAAGTWGRPGLGACHVEADAESSLLHSSFVCIDDGATEAPASGERGVEERDGARPCCLVVRRGPCSRQHVMDALRAAVPSMTRVDSAYVVHRAFSEGSAVACACSTAEAATRAAALNARGVPASADVAASSVLHAALPQLYRVVLHTVRNDMRHMLYVLSVLRQVLVGVPDLLAVAVMQEAQYEGSALVCVCALDQAHRYVKGLREYCLEATLEPLRWGQPLGAFETQIEAVRFGCQLSDVPFG